MTEHPMMVYDKEDDPVDRFQSEWTKTHSKNNMEFLKALPHRDH